MNRIRKIAIIGGESTGKSSLCEALAMHYHTVYVPEYARVYLENIGRPYLEEDLLLIAKGQYQSEIEQEKLANRFLLCDTTLDVIEVWSRHRYNSCASEIVSMLSATSYDAYLLTTPDIPWEYDPLREHPEEAMRMYFFEVYHSIVLSKKKPYLQVRGSMEERIATSVDFLNQNFPLH